MRITAVLLLMLGLAALGLMSARGGDEAYESATETRPARQVESPTFVADLLPLLSQRGCNQSKCHGSPEGKGGWRLSAGGADPAADYDSITKAVRGRRINRVEPAKSLLLLRSHFKVNSPEYNLVVTWVAQGARWDDEKRSNSAQFSAAP